MKEGSRFSDFDQTKTTGQKRKLNESATSQKKSALASKLLDQSFEKISKKSSSHHNQSSSSFSYGPLTQRLISALIEQNLMSPFDNEITDYLDRISPPESSYISPRTLAKKCFTFPSSSSAAASNTPTTSSGSGGVSHIEKKIKKTLIEQGILDIDEDKAANDSDLSDSAVSKDDEIGNEILNIQKELKMVAQQTKQILLHLVDLSKQNLVKQEIRKKIASLDNEVCYSDVFLPIVVVY
jgi:transcriptional adapter 3